MPRIIHITTRDGWNEAQTDGLYRADSLATEGFIHCSTAKQIPQVANRYYRGQSGLVLLVIDTDKAQPEVLWEPPSPPAVLPDGTFPTQELYPHVYGPLNLDAVVEVVDFPPGEDGRFSLPDELR